MSSSFRKPNVFIVYNNDNITSVLAGTFWLKGFEPFKFTNGNESLKRFRELDGKVDAVIVNHEIALSEDILLIPNIKRINPNTTVLVLTDEQYEEKYKTKMYEYGADDIALLPLTPTDISDKILLLLSKRKMLEGPNDLI